MPIEPAHLARSLGALDTLDVKRGFTGTLQHVLRSARSLLDADMAVLMLIDHTGVLRWASASDRMLEARRVQKLVHEACRWYSWSRPAEPVASEHTALVVADDDWTGRCIR
jgi:hypothetical protein